MSTTVFTDVRMIDGDTLSDSVSVIITDGRITEITTASPAVADVTVDGKAGRYFRDSSMRMLIPRREPISTPCCHTVSPR